MLRRSKKCRLVIGRATSRGSPRTFGSAHLARAGDRQQGGDRAEEKEPEDPAPVRPGERRDAAQR
ncbi:hypothetical protein ABZ773_32290, partial [Streptomyces sp. NPDC047804]|uniref:hypothetical protein n=1 Tax=Streptomyces sp. NPDC047804 TaxID=3156663 RepID=UPI0033D111D9